MWTFWLVFLVAGSMGWAIFAEVERRLDKRRKNRAYKQFKNKEK